ncbi:MAG: O-antigen ligase family protein, partial [Rectinema sp.]|nr:O-antigen ligase family protein [Rectinema sp.]
AYTAYIRGFGFRAFGAESWGGMSYLKLIIMGIFLIASKSLFLDERVLRRALFLMLTLSTLPAFAQILFLASGGNIVQQYLFIEAYIGGLLSSLQAVQTGGAVRLHALGDVVGSIMMIAAILLDRSRPLHRIALVPISLIIFFLAALTGFRGHILYIIIMALFLYVFSQGRIRIGRLVPASAGIVATLFAAYLLAPMLPSAMQRALSWIPGIEIPLYIKLEAQMSIINRLELWRMAWEDVPRFLWIGKGFTVNPSDLYSPSVRNDWILYSYLSHNFHNGPLSLLVCTGLFGFLFATLFMITSSVEMIRQYKLVKGAGLMERAYTFFLANHLYQVFAFFAIFGDTRESLPPMFINLAIMHLSLIHI